LDILARLSDFLVRALQKLGKRELHVLRDTLDLVQAFLPGFLYEWPHGVLVQPRRGFWGRRHGRQILGRFYWSKIAQHARLAQVRVAILGDLDGKEALVDHLPKAVHNPRAVEIEA